MRITGDMPIVQSGFLVDVRSSGETVAIHTVGKRMPEDLAAVAYTAGASGLAYDLTDHLSATPIGLTTIRATFEQAAERTDGLD